MPLAKSTHQTWGSRLGSRLWRTLSALLVIGLVWAAGAPIAIAVTTAQTAQPLEVVVVEHLRVQVPADGVDAWLQAEAGSWDPWLQQQAGFLDRQLLWDAEREEGTLLIRWASRDQWKAIPEAEIARVQERFEALARQASGERQGNPFPLVFEGELLPQQLPEGN